MHASQHQVAAPCTSTRAHVQRRPSGCKGAARQLNAKQAACTVDRQRACGRTMQHRQVKHAEGPAGRDTDVRECKAQDRAPSTCTNNVKHGTNASLPYSAASLRRMHGELSCGCLASAPAAATLPPPALRAPRAPPSTPPCKIALWTLQFGQLARSPTTDRCGTVTPPGHMAPRRGAAEDHCRHPKARTVWGRHSPRLADGLV